MICALALMLGGFWIPVAGAAQSADTNAQTVSPAGKAAFFYTDPHVLSRSQHMDLRVAIPKDAAFAADVQTVPVLMSEFADVALEYPIVFIKAPDQAWLALALTGLRRGQNLFVDGDNQWRANYIPASVRRYPFVLADDEQKSSNVAIDMAVTTTDDSGMRLFDTTGQPEPILQTAIAFLQNFQGQVHQTSTLLNRLEELDLLTEAQFKIQNPDGTSSVLNGFHIVEEARLGALRDETIVDLFRKGELAPVQMHLLSLRNIAALQRLEARRVARQTPPTK
jgi:hypothetical protein